MAKKKVDNNYKDLSKQELTDKLNSLNKQLMEMNFQRKTGHVEKPHMFKVVKRDIARVKTFLKESDNG